MRFINQNRTKEIDTSNSSYRFWGLNNEQKMAKDLTEMGWIESDQPLRITDIDCIVCDGKKLKLVETDLADIFVKCKACDGTGKKLNDF